MSNILADVKVNDKQMERIEEVSIRTHERIQVLKNMMQANIDMIEKLPNESEEQNELIEKNKQLELTMQTLQQNLISMMAAMQGRVTTDRKGLVGQLTVAGVMGEEYKKAKQNLDLLEANKHNKMRLTEINTYYANKFDAQSELIKIVIYVALPLLVLAVLGKKNLIPSRWRNLMTALVIVIGGIIIFRKWWDISSRSNMAFNEYDWNWEAPGWDETVYEYDKRWLTQAGKPVSNAYNEGKRMLIGCTGSDCCDTDQIYDPAENKCETKEGFENVSYMNHDVVKCPFKKKGGSISAYNKDSNNFVTF